jgi:hypothetical protein
VEEVLHAADPVHRAGLLDQLPDLLGALDLAPQIDDPSSTLMLTESFGASAGWKIGHV